MTAAKAMNLCIFEDNHCMDLLPLTYTRPCFDLRCGIFTLRQKIEAIYPAASISLLCRDDLARVLEDEAPGLLINQLPKTHYLFVNGRALLGPGAVKVIDPGKEQVYVAKGEIVAAVATGKTLDSIRENLGQPLRLEHFGKMKRVDVDDVTLLQYFWHFIHENEPQIENDFKRLHAGGQILGEVYPGVALLEKANLHVASGAKLKPGVVVDAENGPVHIGSNTMILSNAIIVGPAAIGPDCVVNAGARIYPGTTIGPNSKVGGEVAESIIHAFSNKQHDGFLGHAYLGEWVNLGADTNNSDLKNTYSSVLVEVNGKRIDSDSLFVGCAIGDHSKTGINTMLNTGTVIGAFSNVFGPGFPPKAVPSFSWGGSEGFKEHNLEKALETARRVMQRRNRTLSKQREAHYRHVFTITEAERK